MAIAPIETLSETTLFETVPCYLCGELSCSHFINAQDDLTGKPGDVSLAPLVFPRRAGSGVRMRCRLPHYPWHGFVRRQSCFTNC